MTEAQIELFEQKAREFEAKYKLVEDDSPKTPKEKEQIRFGLELLDFTCVFLWTAKALLTELQDREAQLLESNGVVKELRVKVEEWQVAARKYEGSRLTTVDPTRMLYLGRREICDKVLDILDGKGE